MDPPVDPPLAFQPAQGHSKRSESALDEGDMEQLPDEERAIFSRVLYQLSYLASPLDATDSRAQADSSIRRPLATRKGAVWYRIDLSRTPCGAGEPSAMAGPSLALPRRRPSVTAPAATAPAVTGLAATGPATTGLAATGWTPAW
jgi:hypothetical protein